MSGGDGFVEIKLCAPCAKLDFRDVALGQSKQPRFSDSDGTWDFSDCVPHHDGLEELIECAHTSDGCELCKALALKWTARGESFRWPSGEEYGWYDNAKATLEKEPRLRKCVLVLGPYYQFPLYEAVKTTGVALWNIEGDADLQPEIPLGFAKFYLRRGTSRSSARQIHTLIAFRLLAARIQPFRPNHTDARHLQELQNTGMHGNRTKLVKGLPG